MKHETIEKIKSLINVFATTIGIIIIAIGSVMVLNSVLKLYVFGIETDSYFDAEQECINDIKLEDKLGPSGEILEIKYGEIRKTQEYKDCIIAKTEQEKRSYKKEKTDNMADGIPFIIVGLAILVIYRTRKEKKKN
ncbi:hypothetical protein CSB11_01915 [Candidatus Campbellbacteria bacterium]|nr:MAG: hypothetical protein CSB11_01915 [Candidatus Campbellbacteria bacterium]